MDAYSEDLRRRVVSACDEGELTREEIAATFGVSTSWIRSLLQRRRETGSISALPRSGGREPSFTEEKKRRLNEVVEKNPGATLEVIRKKARLHCSLSTLHGYLKELGWTYKKSHYALLSKNEMTCSS